jgi:hypothetical protein
MYGFPPQRHLLKVEPFLVRLEAARQGLLAAISSDDSLKVMRGVDDVSFWVGRSVAEMISASEAGEENPKLFERSLQILLGSQLAIVQAKKWLKQRDIQPGVNPQDVESFLLPNGIVRSPLAVKASKIPQAGEGVHTLMALPRGTVIGPCRVKVGNTGAFLEDWRSLPTAPMVNHSPFPNMDVIRGKPPNLPRLKRAYPEMSEGSYFVLNRDVLAGDELTSSYRDKGWAEHDYLSSLDFLPLREWDRNVYQLMGARK